MATALKRRHKNTTIKSARRDLGLSVREAAAEINVSPSTWSRVENGVQTPKRKLARKIFRYLNGAVTLGEVYDAKFPGA